MFRYCHGSQEHLDGLFDAQKVPQHQVHSGSDVHLVLGQRQLLQGNTGNTGGIRLSRHRARAHSRHLRASTAAKAAANGSPNVAILPYPREASAVRRYLAGKPVICVTAVQDPRPCMLWRIAQARGWSSGPGSGAAVKAGAAATLLRCEARWCLKLASYDAGILHLPQAPMQYNPNGNI